MNKDIEKQVKSKLSVLYQLTGDADDTTYYKGVVSISHDYVCVGMRKELVDLLRRVPTSYFQNDVFKRHCMDDKEFLVKVEDIAWLIMNFQSGVKSDQN